MIPPVIGQPVIILNCCAKYLVGALAEVVEVDEYETGVKTDGCGDYDDGRTRYFDKADLLYFEEKEKTP